METPDLGVGDAGAETVLGQDGWWESWQCFLPGGRRALTGQWWPS